jgi:hypothetical protein
MKISINTLKNTYLGDLLHKNKGDYKFTQEALNWLKGERDFLCRQAEYYMYVDGQWTGVIYLNMDWIPMLNALIASA